MKGKGISQIVEVTISLPPTPTYSSLVDRLRVFCHKNKVTTEITIEIDKYGDAYPSVQLIETDAALYTEVAKLMVAWAKGELE